VHSRQQLAAVHDQPLEISRRQLAGELVERTARQDALDRERQQLAVVLHVLDAEHLRRRHAHRTRLRHDVLLVGEPRHRLSGDAHDDRAGGRQLDAVRLVHSASREANELVDLVATDRPDHRVDDLTGRRRHHRRVALSDRGSRGDRPRGGLSTRGTSADSSRQLVTT
jgi:hypothetical protein